MARFRVDWAAVQAYYNAGHGRNECMERFGFSLDAWYKAIRFGRLQAEKQRRVVDWDAVQAFYQEGHSLRVCARHFGFTTAAWAKAARRGAIVARPTRWPLDRVLRDAKRRCTVKKALLREGRFINRCDICGIESWLYRPLVMQLDHKNGQPDDHRIENLRMLCPNCHSQTDTFAARNRRSSRQKEPRRDPG